MYWNGRSGKGRPLQHLLVKYTGIVPLVANGKRPQSLTGKQKIVGGNEDEPHGECL